MIEQILGLPEPVVTGILIGSFILVLVLAFKVMEMIFDTVMIAGLSSAFYIGMTYFTAVSFNFNDLLLFSFLGASTYMLYSFLSTIISTTETIIKVPVKLVLGVYKPLKRILGRIIRSLKREIRSLREEEVEEKDSGDKSTKEVVLNSD